MNRWFRLVVCLSACLLGSGICATLAYASTVRTYKSKAVRAYRAGKRLAIRRRYLEAIQKYQEALSFYKQAEDAAKSESTKKSLRLSRGTLLYIVGRTYQLDKQLVKARDYYRKALAVGPKPKARELAQRYLAGVIYEITSTVTLETSPTGGNITVLDPAGRGRFGKAPLTLRLEPGTYTITAMLFGHKTFQTKLNVGPKETLQRNFTLIKDRDEDRPKPRTRPNKRRLVAVVRRVNPKPRRLKMAPQRIAAWTCIGVGGAALLASIVSLSTAEASFSNARPLMGKLESENEFYRLKDQGDLRLGMGTAFMVIAIAAGGVGAILYFIKFKRRPKANKDPATTPTAPSTKPPPPPPPPPASQRLLGPPQLP